MLNSLNVVPLHQTPFSGKSPRKPRNQDARPREYLTADEVDRLMKAARSTGRHGHRDATLILLAYRHGLRVSELVSLKWAQIDLKQGQFAVVRAKNGTPSTHPLRGPEIRALRRLKRAYEGSPYVFVTERKGPLTVSGVRKILARAGEQAGLELSVHPHMLPRLRIQAGQRRPRHPGDPALSGAQADPAYREVYGARVRAVRWVLDGLTFLAVNVCGVQVVEGKRRVFAAIRAREAGSGGRDGRGNAGHRR